MTFRSQVTRYLLAAVAVFAFATARPVLIHASNWKKLSTATTPPARSYCAMAYDPVSKKVVLFGGMGKTGNLNDTWAFDGTNWTQLRTAVAPKVRNGATMAFDRSTKQLVMFGGFDKNKYLQDTWVWNGATSTWTQAQMPSPPPRATGAMLFTDPFSGRAMMFGGFNATHTVPAYSATWRFTGTAWEKLHPKTIPIPRGWGIATLDPLRHNVVLTGGNGDTIRTDNTWTWDGTNWTMLSPATQVSAFIGAGSAFDPAAQAVVVFGGIAETWSWTGNNWVQLAPTNSPSAREGVGMAYDPKTRQTIMFGGLIANGPLTNETWQLVGR
jgi:hypothetical protein